jgi:two-component system, chemotaxis family, CheB/CheR fusion protein
MPTDRVFEEILEKVRELRNFDFRSYKRATLNRRIERRMIERKLKSKADYLAALKKDPHEVDALVSSMLIKVTGFFRDEELWNQLGNKIVPELIAAHRRGDEVRIWSAGCSTGEEAYSLAMIAADAAGNGRADVKIFGTDVEAASVVQARRGIYPRVAVDGVSKDRLERFFITCPEGFQIRPEIRRSVVFGVNNLVSDAPISHIDLILCRNVFIYLNADLQKRVLSRFHYALRPDGLLVLGKAELIPFASRIYDPVELALRIYRKSGDGARQLAPHERLAALQADELVVPKVTAEIPSQVPAGSLGRAVLDGLATPIVVVVGEDATVVFWNAAAARVWGRSEQDVLGRRLSALGLSGLSSDLVMEKTQRVRAGKAERDEVEALITRGEGTLAHFHVEIRRLQAERDNPIVLFTLHDSEPMRVLQAEVLRVSDDIQAANEKLKSSNEELRASNEELETTNEELQSANEELQTTNEELQSTNEELETTNEELQSANEELDEINRELARRTEQINLLALYQRTIIRSLTTAVVVLDTTGRVTAWNLAAERLLGLPEGEAVGQTFWTLRIPALSRALVQRIRRSLGDNRALRVDEVDYETPTGGTGNATIVAIPLIQDGTNVGTVLLFDDATRLAALLEENRQLKERAKDVPRRARAKDGA